MVDTLRALQAIRKSLLLYQFVRDGEQSLSVLWQDWRVGGAITDSQTEQVAGGKPLLWLWFGRGRVAENSRTLIAGAEIYTTHT